MLSSERVINTRFLNHFDMYRTAFGFDLPGYVVSSSGLRLDANKMLGHWEGNGHGRLPTTAQGNTVIKNKSEVGPEGDGWHKLIL